jgi:GNAT superfamily N-acetyltransferase
MADALTIRMYTAADMAACLALFDSNTPEFFAPSERAEFEAYLRAPGGTVLVAEAPEVGVIGVGGFYLRPTDECAASGPVAGLAWGMVARAWHRRGVGRALLRARLDALEMLGVAEVSVRTSQYSRGFFERAGFTATRQLSDGFTPGIDLVELRLVGLAPRPGGAPVV